MLTPGGNQQMFARAEYQHPQLKPYSSGSWKEIAYAWIFATIIVGAVLLTM